jgi:hypothetical protein
VYAAIWDAAPTALFSHFRKEALELGFQGFDFLHMDFVHVICSEPITDPQNW